MIEPVIIGTWSFAHAPCAAEGSKLAEGGSSLDAVEAVCRAVEDDPDVDSVGFGGLADRAGDVTLDGCIMRSPRECGSVCAIRRHRHPVSIARRVMEQTSHVMLAGAGADAFASAQGFPVEDPCADDVKAKWRVWKDAPHEIDQSRDSGIAPLRPMDSGAGGRLFPELHGHDDGPADGGTGSGAGHDTVGALALDRHGVLAGACSTSGTPYKLPGRVGDAPIIGHGLYVDPGAGAATATGSGELVMGLCSSFHAVELMRGGATPLDALLHVVGRIRDTYELRPQDQVAMLALAPDGARAAVALRPGFRWVVANSEGADVCAPDRVLLPA